MNYLFLAIVMSVSFFLYLLSRLNHELEEQAQRAINSYFSTHVIAPSPWTDSAKKNKPFKPPCTPGSGHLRESHILLSVFTFIIIVIITWLVTHVSHSRVKNHKLSKAVE